MEAKASFQREKEDKPAETKKLKIAWPPPAELGSSGSTMEEGFKVSKPKWPPEEETGKTEAPEDVDLDLKKLRRSSSLKERSRPFTVAASFRTSSVKSPKMSPLGKCMESAEGPGQNGNVDKARCQSRDSTREEAVRSKDIHGVELESENFIENGANIDEDDSNDLTQQSPLEPESPSWSRFVDTTPTKEFTTQNQKSQDVGFWEGEVVRELSVEEQIKRNRYYDEDEDEE